jgi:hypothetical protein
MSRKVKALCEDGIVRTATITGEADSYWSAPARVSVKGRTITGHVFQDSAFTTVTDPDGNVRTVEHPVTDATLYYADAPDVILGRMLFVARRPLPDLTGSRVELHPGMDAWMQGDRYGEVIRTGRTLYHVRMDRSGRILRVSPDRLTVLDSRMGWNA